MDNWIIMLGFALVFLFTAMVYVTLKNRNQNQEKNNKFETYEKPIKRLEEQVTLKNRNLNKEKDEELETYKKQMDRLEEQFRRKKISKNTYELLRKNLEEQHRMTISQNFRRRVK